MRGWVALLFLYIVGAIAQQTTNARSAYWPFDQPSISVLRNATKKVWINYFPPYPLSFDNKNASVDYYTLQYMNPAGVNGQFLNAGGLLRDRPIPRPIINSPLWKNIDLGNEVNLAINLGSDGFVSDVLTPGYFANTGDNRWELLLNVSNSIDPGFKIIYQPDMNAMNPAQIFPFLQKYKDYPALYKTSDGRIVIAPYFPEKQNASWWQQQMANASAQGFPIAFVGVFQPYRFSLAAFANISYGVSDWGVRGASAMNIVAPQATSDVKKAKSDLFWMMYIGTQDFRPKSLTYKEVRGSEGFRRAWEIARDNGSLWTHMITWNDYSEASEFAPSVGTQYAFYDLSAYYITWYKLGSPPAIVRDVLYYFHRNQHSDAAYNTTAQPNPFTCPFCTPTNEIELLAFLTQPGTLTITYNGTVYSTSASAGITPFYVPFTNTSSGVPSFSLIRNGQTVISISSSVAINNYGITYQNFLYYAGSSSPSDVRSQSSTRV